MKINVDKIEGVYYYKWNTYDEYEFIYERKHYSVDDIGNVFELVLNWHSISSSYKWLYDYLSYLNKDKPLPKIALKESGYYYDY